MDPVQAEPKKPKKKSKKSKPTLVKKVKKIMDDVHKVCYFGSYNKGVGSEAYAAFKKLIIAIHVVFNYKDFSSVENKLLEEDKKLLAELKSQTKLFAIDMYGIMHYKQYNQLTFLPLQNILSPRILAIVKKIYPPSYFSFNPRILSNLGAAFSFYFYEFVGRSKMKIGISHNLDDSLQVIMEKMGNELAVGQQIRYNILFQNGAHSDSDRAFFFEQTVRFAKEISGDYGFGNCGHMADLALLSAIDMGLSCGITYIKFYNEKNPAIEELNAIVLGDWPQKDCLIFSPWLGEKGEYFYWQGSVAHTPEFTKYKHDAFQVICELKKDKKAERDAFKKQLQESDYANWIHKTRRQTNLALVEQFVINFSEDLQKCGYMDEAKAADSRALSQLWPAAAASNGGGIDKESLKKEYAELKKEQDTLNAPKMRLEELDLERKALEKKLFCVDGCLLQKYILQETNLTILGLKISLVDNTFTLSFPYASDEDIEKIKVAIIKLTKDKPKNIKHEEGMDLASAEINLIYLEIFAKAVSQAELFYTRKLVSDTTKLQQALKNSEKRHEEIELRMGVISQLIPDLVAQNSDARVGYKAAC